MWLPLTAPALPIVLLLQVIRAKFSRAYRRAWPLLVLGAVPWGAYGLYRYLPNIEKWSEVHLFIPGLALAVLVGKAGVWLCMRDFLIVLAAAIVLGVLCAFAVTDNLHHLPLLWLLMLISNPGGGLAGGLYGVDVSDLQWMLEGAPGVVLTACVLAVPARYRGLNQEERSDHRRSQHL